MIDTINKKKVRELFVRLVNTIGMLKKFGDREEDILATIGAMKLRIDELGHDSSPLKHEDEIHYYRKGIAKKEMALSDVQLLYREYKEGSEKCHQELIHAAFIEQGIGTRYHFLLPSHTTFGQRTLVPGFNSMIHADVDTIEFIEVHRTLDANKQGAYLVYPTMGKADFGTVV